MTTPAPGSDTPGWLWLAGAGFLAVVAVIVISSLRRPDVPMFRPDPPAERPIGSGLAHDTVTIDARDPDRWVLFDVRRRTVVSAGDDDWDLAVKRFHIVVNGGPGFAGNAEGMAVEAPWEAVLEAPETGYERTEGTLARDPRHPAFDHWYDYSFLSHLLEPRDRTYLLRTSEGSYAKLRILSYYCPDAAPGCLTLELAVRGDGSRALGP